jgi:hypothetical protein
MMPNQRVEPTGTSLRAPAANDNTTRSRALTQFFPDSFSFATGSTGFRRTQVAQMIGLRAGLSQGAAAML